MRLHRNPELERRIQERMETRLSARWERTLRSDLRGAASDAASAYEASGMIEPAIRAHDEVVDRVLRSMYESAFVMTADRVGRQFDDALGKSFWSMEMKNATERYAEALDKFIRKWVGTKVVQISSTTVDMLQRVIQNGIEEGMGADAIARQIRQKGAEFSAYRAHAIARTEVHASSQFGSMAAAQDAGEDIFKHWVPVDDGRTRTLDNSDFDHANVEPVPVNRPFIVSGEEMMHPGDPAGSAGNVILCRCAMTYEVR